MIDRALNSIAPVVLVALLSGCQSQRPLQPATTVTRSALVSPDEAIDQEDAEGIVHISLIADELDSPNGQYRYAYNGQTPGPTIRATVGDELIVDFENRLDLPTTIHWHGLHVPFEMDGVAWMGAPVAPGETFQYRFPLQQTGTFWYHPHFNTSNQVDGGLFGALIIEDPVDPEPDDELILVFDAAAEFGGEPSDTSGVAGEQAVSEVVGTHHGRATLVTDWLVNGQRDPVYTAVGGSVVRARIINVSNVGYLALSWPDIHQIGSDQGMLPQAQSPDRLVLAPSDRAEVSWRIGEAGFTVEALPYTLNGGDAYGPPESVFAVEVSDPGPLPAELDWPFIPAEPTVDPGRTDVLYTLTGSDRTGQWLINGERFPDITIHELEWGVEAIIEVRNVSPSEHPFHLHGHAFEVLSIDGVAPAYRQIEDTVNIGIRERLRIRLLADNPGDWMTHCHILPHAGEGMMTVLRVLPP